jgi:hypothetical protein
MLILKRAVWGQQGGQWGSGTQQGQATMLRHPPRAAAGRGGGARRQHPRPPAQGHYPRPPRRTRPEAEVEGVDGQKVLQRVGAAVVEVKLWRVAAGGRGGSFRRARGGGSGRRRPPAAPRAAHLCPSRAPRCAAPRAARAAVPARRASGLWGGGGGGGWNGGARGARARPGAGGGARLAARGARRAPPAAGPARACVVDPDVLRVLHHPLRRRQDGEALVHRAGFRQILPGCGMGASGTCMGRELCNAPCEAAPAACRSCAPPRARPLCLPARGRRGRSGRASPKTRARASRQQACSAMAAAPLRPPPLRRRRAHAQRAAPPAGRRSKRRSPAAPSRLFPRPRRPRRHSEIVSGRPAPPHAHP